MTTDRTVLLGHAPIGAIVTQDVYRSRWTVETGGHLENVRSIG
jgi:hypothetical protein